MIIVRFLGGKEHIWGWGSCPQTHLGYVSVAGTKLYCMVTETHWCEQVAWVEFIEWVVKNVA